jgi:hypothetical protein
MTITRRNQMNKLRIPLVLTVAAAVLACFSATAVGTTITAPTGTKYTGYFHETSEGHIVIHNPIAKVECASTIDGDIESHGTGVPVGGKLTNIVNSPCTDDWHVTTVAPGSISINWASSGVGTVASTGMTIEATRFGIACRYATSSTDVGRWTDSHQTGRHATWHVAGNIPFHSGSIFCGSGATTWTGSYTLNTPSRLYIDS